MSESEEDLGLQLADVPPATHQQPVMQTPTRTLGFALLVIVLVAGCAAAANDSPAVRTERFYTSLAEDRAVAACADLATGTRSTLEQEERKECPEVILDQDLPTVSGKPSVKVYGSMAQIVYTNETVFLSRYANGWRVTAAGCKPAGADRSYECTLTVN